MFNLLEASPSSYLPFQAILLHLLFVSGADSIEHVLMLSSPLRLYGPWDMSHTRRASKGNGYYEASFIFATFAGMIMMPPREASICVQETMPSGCPSFREDDMERRHSSLEGGKTSETSGLPAETCISLTASAGLCVRPHRLTIERRISLGPQSRDKPWIANADHFVTSIKRLWLSI
ncbi:hypothetical protein BDW59DRAFT_139980 [Aspergillus cavernicola]|uniref:Uncharacterized protein n=1 Tax=Aspergillus cavernicola TaxID=176166 RepID=A0ABR4IVG8_9EURO